jgi:hypothetical protein
VKEEAPPPGATPPLARGPDAGTVNDAEAAAAEMVLGAGEARATPEVVEARKAEEQVGG